MVCAHCIWNSLSYGSVAPPICNEDSNIFYEVALPVHQDQSSLEQLLADGGVFLEPHPLLQGKNMNKDHPNFFLQVKFSKQFFRYGNPSHCMN